jgi:GH18 family chitinase
MRWTLAWVLSTAALAGCGDDAMGGPDGAMPRDSGRTDDAGRAPGDAGGEDAGSDAGSPGDGGLPTGRPIVYAWFPATFGDFRTDAIDWSAITHLSYRSIEILPDGTLREPRSRAEVAALVAEGHANDVEVTVLVWGTDQRGSSTYLAMNRDRAVASLAGYVRDTGIDGLNMDDETWRETNVVTGEPNRDLVTAFFTELRAALDAEAPGSHLTWASPGVIAPSDRYGEAWPDYAAIAEVIDAFAVMAYVMNPPTIGWTTGALPLRGGGRVGEHPRDAATVVADYLAATGGRADRILLGLSNDYGGTEWDARGPDALAPIAGAPRRLTAEEARTNAAARGRMFHPEQQVPWYRYEEGDHFVQGFYEDEESIRAKLDHVRAQGLLGVCVWVLDGASEPPITFELLSEL